MLNELPTNELKLGIDIRWNSLYEMLNIFHTNKDAINLMLNNNEEGVTETINVSDVESEDDITTEAKDKKRSVLSL